MKLLNVPEFLSFEGTAIAIDVRSPLEFEQGHIPGALSFPLFSNAERAEIGTLYKKSGQRQAILRGLEIIGPKMRPMAEQMLRLAKDKALYIHCWRGGMRSQSVAMLAGQLGIPCFVLKGGYKAYRNSVLEGLSAPLKYTVLTGFTGSGKTKILQKLRDFGAQVMDLEGLANHLGSSFGGIGQEEQPSTEYFQNLCFTEIQKWDLTKLIWIEDESAFIGNCFLPTEMYRNMQNANWVQIILPLEERITFITEVYGYLPKEEISQAIQRIQKRLGPAQTQAALAACEENDVQKCVEILLQYYDKHYQKSIAKKDIAKGIRLEYTRLNFDEIAQDLSELKEKLWIKYD